jgi:hypothetical protein
MKLPAASCGVSKRNFAVVRLAFAQRRRLRRVSSLDQVADAPSAFACAPVAASAEVQAWPTVRCRLFRRRRIKKGGVFAPPFIASFFPQLASSSDVFLIKLV